MNDLEKFFRKEDKRFISKWTHYFDVYDRHFSRFRNKEIVILEIGVSEGGSLHMWRDYFGEKAKIYGVDINPRCKELEEENIKIFIGSQSDRKFLKSLVKQIPPIDILIDDGGHTMKQQIASYEELINHVKDDGIFLSEDLHTSYWLGYGGGHKRRGTFIEYTKNFIDFLNANHSEQRSLSPTRFTNTIDSIHYYDSIIVLEKKKKEISLHENIGQMSFPPQPEISSSQKLINRVKNSFNKYANLFLRFFRLKGYSWR